MYFKKNRMWSYPSSLFSIHTYCGPFNMEKNPKKCLHLYSCVAFHTLRLQTSGLCKTSSPQLNKGGQCRRRRFPVEKNFIQFCDIYVKKNAVQFI